MAVAVISPTNDIYEVYDTAREALAHYRKLSAENPSMPLCCVDYHDADSDENGTVLAKQNMS